MLPLAALDSGAEGDACVCVCRRQEDELAQHRCARCAGPQPMKFHATLKDICLFVAVFEERSFTRAASRENATHSGVSQHIRKLEASHGVSLFVRHAG